MTGSQEMSSIWGSTILINAQISTQASAADAPGKRTFLVELSTPASNYRIAIDRVYQAGDEIWVVAKVSGGGIGAAVISKVRDEITIAAPKGKVVNYVLNKTWKWTDKKEYHYPSDKEFAALLKKHKAKQIWQREKKKKK